jgi:hypothetical protein
MSREIKFRAWRDDLKEWVHKEPCNILGETILLGNWMDGVGVESLNDVVIDQFTGARDRNGNEIFEHDLIVRKEFVYEVMYSSFKAKYLATWMHGGHQRYKAFLWEDVEVVGNIHENPEYMK